MVIDASLLLSLSLPLAPELPTTGPFQAGPAWDDRTVVFFRERTGIHAVSAGPAVRQWRAEVDHAAVVLLLERLPS